jgi:large subunit ribosomal protein L25
MEEIKLDVHLRQRTGRREVKKVRQEDCVPAIVYGGDRGPTSIKLDRRKYEKIVRQHPGESLVFHLDVFEGDKKLRDYAAIVKEEQLHPVSDDLVHIDFKRINLKEKIEIKVPILVRGEAIGVKQDGGSVDNPLWELEVFCLPTNIPQNIEVDVSELKIGDAIHVRDLTLPENVITNHDPESIIVSVVPPMREEEPEVDEDAEPEVVGAKKEGEAEEESKEGAEKTADASSDDNKEEKSKA